MAVQFAEDVSQETVLDEAEKLAQRVGQASFDESVEVFRVVNDYDVRAAAAELKALVDSGRATLYARDAAQTDYVNESEDSRVAVDEVGKFIRNLHNGVRYARTMNHPLASKLPAIALMGQANADTWRDSRGSLGRVLANLEANAVDPVSLGLPADFLDQGKRLVIRLAAERDEASDDENVRTHSTARLHVTIDAIVQKLEQMMAVRELAMDLTGKHIPGFELAMIRAAAAPRTGGDKPDGDGSGGTGGTGGGATGL